MLKRRITFILITHKYIDYTRYAHNKALIEQLQRAAEALVAFRKKVEEDAILICDLRDQINSDNASWEVKYPYFA